MAQYLLKYIDSTGKKTVALPTDVFAIGGLTFGTNPQIYNDTTIALLTDLDVLETSLQAEIDAAVGGVSGDFQNQLDNLESSLQGQIDYVSGVVDSVLVDLTEDQEVRIESGSGQTIFSVSGYFSFDFNNNNREIEVYKNGLKMFQSSTGNISGGDFEKISSTEIEFFYGLNLGDRVVVRLE